MDSIWYIFLGIYFTINFALSMWVYSQMTLFYKEKIVLGSDAKTKENLHDKYLEFKKTDSLSFIRILIGTNLFFWPKCILLVLTAFFLMITLYIISWFYKGSNRLSLWIVKSFLSFATILVGLRKNNERTKCDKVYKEYFGENYEIKYDEGYSIIISNHTGWIDIICYLSKFACGFISKEEVANYPIIGIVGKQINCLFLRREDSKDRHKLLELIQKRQEEYISSPNLAPMIIFPEGTVTSGGHVLKFKKGAFSSLLPIKPMLIQTNLSDTFHLSCGSAPLLVHFIRTLCYFYHNISILELPIMTPTEHMYQYYQKLHPEIIDRWEIFSEVAREVYVKIGNFKKSSKTLTDSCIYADAVNNKEKKEKLLEKSI